MTQQYLQKLELLSTISTYIYRMYDAVDAIIEELTLERFDDTDDYLKVILESLDWVCQGCSALSDLFKEENPDFDPQLLVLNYDHLKDVARIGDDQKLAATFKEDWLDTLACLRKDAQSILNNHPLVSI